MSAVDENSYLKGRDVRSASRGAERQTIRYLEEKKGINGDRAERAGRRKAQKMFLTFDV